MITRTTVALSVALAVVFGLFCTLSTLYYLQTGELLGLSAQLTAAQASSRRAWQKVYDLQEADQDVQSEKEGQLQVKVWELEQKLTTCATPQKVGG